MNIKKVLLAIFVTLVTSFFIANALAEKNYDQEREDIPDLYIETDGIKR